MGCCIQSSLAKILAEFEIALERDVLQPLNKLSEVALATLPAPLSHPTSPSCPQASSTHCGPSLPQEELPIILKRKKTLQKLISDWNTIKSRYGAHCGWGAKAYGVQPPARLGERGR